MAKKDFDLDGDGVLTPEDLLRVKAPVPLQGPVERERWGCSEASEDDAEVEGP